MKRILIIAGMILLTSLAPVQTIHAQIPILEIIKAAVKKVIKAASLTPENRYLSLSSLGFQKTEKNDLLNDTFQEDVSIEILKHCHPCN